MVKGNLQSDDFELHPADPDDLRYVAADGCRHHRLSAGCLCNFCDVPVLQETRRIYACRGRTLNQTAGKVVRFSYLIQIKRVASAKVRAAALAGGKFFAARTIFFRKPVLTNSSRARSTRSRI